MRAGKPQQQHERKAGEGPVKAEAADAFFEEYAEALADALALVLGVPRGDDGIDILLGELLGVIEVPAVYHAEEVFVDADGVIDIFQTVVLRQFEVHELAAGSVKLRIRLDIGALPHPLAERKQCKCRGCQQHKRREKAQHGFEHVLCALTAALEP